MRPATTVLARALLFGALFGLASACSGGGGHDDGESDGNSRGGSSTAGRVAQGRGASAGSGAGGQSTAGGAGATNPTGGNGTTGGAMSGGAMSGGGPNGGTTDGGATGAGGSGSAGRSATQGGAPGAGLAGADGGTNAGGAGAVSAGNAGSGSAGAPPVDLPPGVTGLFPAPNATSVCSDAQLRLTFAAPPKLGDTGTIQVLSDSGTVVASVNMANMTVTDTIGGQMFTLVRPVYIDGSTVVVYLPQKALAYGKTYTAHVPAGAIVPSGGGSFSISGDAWRFTTAAAAPSNLANLTVALDGSAPFCSVQGALDALPSNNSAKTSITVSAGNYYEVVYFKSKNNITLHGASRSGTVILGTNNNAMNSGTKIRALVGADGSHDLVFENLTIKNLTPQGGSQAEALRLETCTHCTIRDADILSLQDTLLWSGTLYAKNCTIAGNVDFVWGTGAAYFDSCEIKTVGRSGYVVQARNATDGYGYVFVDSKITSDTGITGSALARVDVSVYPGSHVAYVNCALGTHISAAGWVVTGGSPTSALRFWEYKSTDLAGKPLDVSKRLSGSTQISDAQAATMRDPSAVLGGWQPE